MSQDRYQELLSLMLDDELSGDELSELARLVKDHPSRQQVLQSQLEAAEMIAQSEDDLRDSSLFVAAVKSRVGEDPFVSSVREAIDETDRRSSLREPKGLITERRAKFARWPWAVAAVAAAAVVALIAGFYLLGPSGDPQIARITGLGGSVLWTGNGGRVTGDLSVGDELTGGTIEGAAPDSWVELEFIDGSKVMISGSSRLTFSDFGQKELRLKEGNVSASVKPQRRGKPMLVHTRSAQLEVLGTKFEVETDLASTALDVNEGTVRMKRLSDGRSVDVPAQHRVVAAADLDLSLKPIPESVHQWKSQLHLGPDGTLGQWFPKTNSEDAKLRAVPYPHTTQGQTITVYVAGLRVSEGDKPPVVLPADSRIRVRGRIKSAHELYFGVTVRHVGGGFAGNFFAIRSAREFGRGANFEVLLGLRELQLDPALAHMKDELARSPADGVIEAFYCTSATKPAGLEILKVEMFDPRPDAP